MNWKVGDRAIVIRSDMFPEMIGTEVLIDHLSGGKLRGDEVGISHSQLLNGQSTSEIPTAWLKKIDDGMETSSWKAIHSICGYQPKGVTV